MASYLENMQDKILEVHEAARKAYAAFKSGESDKFASASAVAAGYEMGSMMYEVFVSSFCNLHLKGDVA